MGTSGRRKTKGPEAPTHLLATALASAANAVFITDSTGHIVWVNAAFCQLSGYSMHEAIGHTPAFLKSGQQTSEFYGALRRTIFAGDVWRGEIVERRKDGTLYTVDETISPVRDSSGTVTHFIAIQNDITERKEESKRSHFLAYHDALTGLPNRYFFLEALDQAIARAENDRASLAVLFVDLDSFKPVNDSLGHAIGDRLLMAVGGRLSSAVRASEVVARIGGDEFAVLLTNIPGAATAATVAKNLLEAVAQPFVLEGHTVQTTASIGISVCPSHAKTGEDLLDRADQAMYRAKRLGRNRYEIYTDEHDEASS